MKTKILSIILAILLIGSCVYAGILNNKAGHEKYLYPVVRVTYGFGGGSGSVIYSNPGEDGKYSTYVLTNCHVINSAISVREEWDPGLQKEVKKEKREIVYVEFFEYCNLSIPTGTRKVEADIAVYNRDEDMALLKVRSEKPAEYIVSLYPEGKENEIYVLDETIAAGCSLGFPPLPTEGMITRKGFQIDSYEFWMSSSQIIYGNSGGAMFLASTGELIGIPSRVALVGWATPITHMGLFIPISRIYKWLEEEHYDFIWKADKSEKECLELREKELKAKRKDLE